MSTAIRAAAIADGIVVNVEMIEPGYERNGVVYVPSDTAGIGDRYEGGEFVRAEPQPEPEPVPITVYKLDLFERTTNTEAEAILAAMDAQPARIRMIFNAAQSFREDHELWPLLTGAATEMFGAERAGELLAPSVA